MKDNIKSYIITAIGVGFICVLMLIAPFFMFSRVVKENVEYREIAAFVDEVNPSTNCTTLVDANGEAWLWDGTEFEEGQPVIIVFNTMGTDEIYDDEITQIIFEKGA